MLQNIVPTLAVSGFGFIFVVVGLVLLNSGRKARAKSSRIGRDAKIRDVQPGTVEIEDTAHLPEDETLLESPIQRADALAHHVEVEEWDNSGEGSGSWKTKHE